MNILHNNIMKDKLCEIVISQECIYLVALRIYPSPRSSSQFYKGQKNPKFRLRLKTQSLPRRSNCNNLYRKLWTPQESHMNSAN